MRLAVPLEPAVFDANGIVGLAKSDCLELVPRLFRGAFVSSSVVQEIRDPVSLGALELALASWLAKEDPGAPSLQQVPDYRGTADRSVVALALEHRPCIIVTGDRWIISRAREFGIPTISAPRVVQLLAQASMIGAAKPHLDQMIRLGFGVPSDVYQAILQSLEE